MKRRIMRAPKDVDPGASSSTVEHPADNRETGVQLPSGLPDPADEQGPITRYFDSPSKQLQFISSGCSVLDCVLGGGYALGRICNIIGDKSTGKTLLGIEACNNFAVTYPKGHIWYNEVEAAFDTDYAAALGLPIARVEFQENQATVEDYFKNLDKCIEVAKKSGEPGLYILDSMDALSDAAEIEREIDAGSYGAGKARKLSEVFRRQVLKLKNQRIAVLIISQVRDNIGAMFGEKYKRSGGKALDFYASQCLWLAQTGQIKRTIDSVERTIGVSVKANCKKNKIGLPFRECELEIRFGFGIDDVAANINYLEAVNKLELVGLNKDKITRFLRSLEKMSDDEYRTTRTRIAAIVRQVWSEVEKSFLPTRRKY
jgi:recombination protein RecA